MNPAPWLLLEIEKSSFFTPASLNRYLESLSRQLGPWVPRERWIVLAPQEELALLPVLAGFSSQIFLRSRGWGNAVALFCIFLELESRDRDAEVIYLPASPHRRLDRMGSTLRKGCLAAQEHPASVLLLGYPGSVPSLPLSHSEEEEFARGWLRQGACRDSGIWLGKVGMALLFYMLSQAEMIAPFLRQRRGGGEKAVAELPEDSIPKDFRRDVLRENLPLLRCLEISELDEAERERSHLSWTERAYRSELSYPLM